MKKTGIQLIDNNDAGNVLDLKVNTVYDASGKIISGLVIGDTLEQNKALILIAHPGDFKHRPDIGVGLGDIQFSEDYLEYRHRIREHFAKDGLRVTELDLYENKPIRIIADYE
ncbi:hypothetical protein [Flavobacterium cerinum]|nr:hypothetical protein [Flavobacterium cerinum]